MTDLQEKYSILASEYSKLRAQIPVLKKAVLDEQANEELLKLNLKEKELAIRKFEQEVDSLKFRNLQLSTRIAALQRELDEKGKKIKQSPLVDVSASHGSASVIDAELRSKIEENARLNREVYESAQTYSGETARLQEQLSVLQAEATRHDFVLAAAVSANQDQVVKLQEEKTILESKLLHQEKETRQAVQSALELQEKIMMLEKELETGLRQVSGVLQQKLPFNDTADPSLNALNLPPHDHRRHLAARELVTQADTLVGALVKGFGDLYSHSTQRARILSDMGDKEPLGQVSRAYCQQLAGQQTVLKRVRHAFEVFHENITDDRLVVLETGTSLQDFAAAWRDFTAYTQKLLLHQLQTLDEESALASCPRPLADKNSEIKSSLEQLDATLCRIDNYVCLFAQQSVPNGDHPDSSLAKIFELMSSAMTDFHENMRDLSRNFNAKLSLEHQLPTFTQKLRVADECILSAIVSLVNCTGKLSTFFAGNLSFFTPTSDGSERDAAELTAHPCVTQLRQRAVDYIGLITRPPPESVPYNEALENRTTVYSFTENRDSLTQQVIGLQEKLNALETEREHWLLNSQLLQLQYQKEAQSGTNSTTALGAEAVGPVSSSSGRSAGDDGLIHTSLLGRVDRSTTVSELQGEGVLREELITKHYKARYADTISDLQLADSKALHFHSECRALQRRLSVREQERARLQEELSAANQSIAQLKDELQTTTRSYEAQLSMISEHHAGMKEHLSAQQDEISALKHQLLQASSPAKSSTKKGKSGR